MKWRDELTKDEVENEMTLSVRWEKRCTQNMWGPEVTQRNGQREIYAENAI